MRAGEELVPMTPDQLKRIVEEGQPEFVDQPARFGLSEEEVVTLLDVQSYYDLRKRPMPSTRREKWHGGGGSLRPPSTAARWKRGRDAHSLLW